MPNKPQIGETFTRYTVLSLSDKQDKLGRAFYNCICTCGNTRTVRYDHLTSGRSKSCGCLSKDSTGFRFTKHGLTETSEFTAWVNMRERCYNSNVPNYHNYGGRGIRVCASWMESFENFIKDMGFKPVSNLSLDRIDVNGNYTPENCRWTDWLTQANNRRNNKLR